MLPIIMTHPLNLLAPFFPLLSLYSTSNPAPQKRKPQPKGGGPLNYISRLKVNCSYWLDTMKNNYFTSRILSQLKLTSKCLRSFIYGLYFIIISLPSLFYSHCHMMCNFLSKTLITIKFATASKTHKMSELLGKFKIKLNSSIPKTLTRMEDLLTLIYHKANSVMCWLWNKIKNTGPCTLNHVENIRKIIHSRARLIYSFISSSNPTQLMIILIFYFLAFYLLFLNIPLDTPMACPPGMSWYDFNNMRDI